MSLLPTEAEWNALALSLRVAAAAVLAILVPGVAIAWLLARRRFPGRSVLDAVVHLPLVLPPVSWVWVLLMGLGRGTALGRFLEDRLGLEIAFTWKAAAVASAIMGFPLLVRPVRLAIEMADDRLESAAATLGAGPWRRLFTITLPLALPGLLTRDSPRVCPQPRRVRGDDHLRGQHPRRDTHPAAGDLHVRPVAGR